MDIKSRIKVSISNIPKAVKPIPGIQDSLITRSGRVFLKERSVWYEIIPKINKRSLSRILLLHPNTINRVLNKPQDYEY